MTVERGALQAALVELLIAQMKLNAAVAVWLSGERMAPLIQLRHLSEELDALEAVVRKVRDAGKREYRAEVERQRALGEPEVPSSVNAA
jgi:hypothetical protein